MNDDKTLMPFWDHIEELRKRLFVAVIFLAITTLISFLFAENLLHFLAQPMGGLEKLQAIEITESVGVFARVSLLSGFVLALPVILYEIILFISPGLKKSEIQWLYFGVIFGTVFFCLGIIFAYFVMLPPALDLLINFMGINTVPRLSSYTKFLSNLLFWIGLAFQLPLIAFFLTKIGILQAQTLIKKWRYAVIIITVLAAVITPTVDPVNMALLMAPLIVLYFISILFSFIAQGKQKSRIR